MNQPSRPASRGATAHCTRCGAVLPGEQEWCRNCGAIQVRCMVCKGNVRSEDDSTKCPHCEGIAHRIDLLEWLKVKGTCPRCKKNLQKKELP